MAVVEVEGGLESLGVAVHAGGLQGNVVAVIEEKVTSISSSARGSKPRLGRLAFPGGLKSEALLSLSRSLSWAPGSQ